MVDDKVKLLNKEIIAVSNKFPNGASIDEIRLAYNPEINIRTLQRRLAKLAEHGVIIISGNARTTIYKLTTNTTDTLPKTTILIPLTEESIRIRTLVTAPIQKRKPVGYQRFFLESYQPNVDSYLTEEDKSRLGSIGDTKIDQPAGTFAQQILNCLLIDLSWNSKRLHH